MSYTQYQQYGGNPYDNGPEAEAGAGQGDGVSISLTSKSGDPAQLTFGVFSRIISPNLRQGFSLKSQITPNLHSTLIPA
jgi:hypothetical protein